MRGRRYPERATYGYNKAGVDKPLTTDFRGVFADILSRHLGAGNLAPVFPGYDGKPLTVF